MAISQVRVQINGIWTTLTYNATSQAYEATITAPSASSFKMTGGYYPVTVEATNTVGTKTTVNDSTATIGTSCKLFVAERTAPVVTIVTPAADARVTNSKQGVVFNVTDETGGSGVDPGTIQVFMDGQQQLESTYEISAITNGYRCTFTPPAALSDGIHVFSAKVSDFDGNEAAERFVSFTVDTIAPTLNVTSPAEGSATSSTSVVVAGTTNDVTSSPVTLTQALDGGAAQAVTVGTNGAFTKTWTGLAHGAHKVVIVAKDVAGKTTTVTRNFTVDTSKPVISSVTITPKYVDAGKTVVIKVVVTG